MVNKEYNPYEILDIEIVRKHFSDIAQKMQSESFFSSKNIRRSLANRTFCFLTGTTNFVGVGYAKLNEIGQKYNFKKFMCDQINYLEKHPDKIKQEVKVNLVIASILFHSVYRIKEINNVFSRGANYIWKMAENFSITEGIMEGGLEEEKQWQEKMWFVLKNPIALILNHYIINQRMSWNEVHSMISLLFRAGESSNNILDLTLQKMHPLFETNIISYLQNGYENMESLVKKNYCEFPKLDNWLDSIRNSKDFLLKEVQDYQENNQ